MALDLLGKTGFGQLELNQVAFRRDGRIEAQCKLDSTEFESAPAENGMLLAVNNITRTVTKADTDDIGINPIGLHYSTEHMYDDRASALKDFALELGSFLPRIGYLSVGDKFTTNLVGIDDDDTTGYASETVLTTALAAATLATTPVYGGVHDDAPGIITLSKATFATGPLFKVTKLTTMPDGQKAVQLQVLRA